MWNFVSLSMDNRNILARPLIQNSWTTLFYLPPTHLLTNLISSNCMAHFVISVVNYLYKMTKDQASICLMVLNRKSLINIWAQLYSSISNSLIISIWSDLGIYINLCERYVQDKQCEISSHWGWTTGTYWLDLSNFFLLTSNSFMAELDFLELHAVCSGHNNCWIAKYILYSYEASDPHKPV